jgi:hypothetical protein
VSPIARVKSALISCPKTDFPLNPGINRKNAAAQEMMLAKIKKTRGILSLGKVPLWRISGSTQIMKRRIKGKTERGETRALVKEENNGKVVTGKQIKTIAQRTSQVTSRRFSSLLEIPICPAS